MATAKRERNPIIKGRPVKVRIVRSEPKTKQFSPRGRVGRPGNTVLKYEEFEAIRLTDHMGLDQRQAAANMGISQQTYSRILRSGRARIAEALVQGDTLKVGGGHYQVNRSV